MGAGTASDSAEDSESEESLEEFSSSTRDEVTTVGTAGALRLEGLAPIGGPTLSDLAGVLSTDGAGKDKVVGAWVTEAANSETGLLSCNW